MEIAISATGRTLDAEVDPRPGRHRYFNIADPETVQFETEGSSSAIAAGRKTMYRGTRLSWLSGLGTGRSATGQDHGSGRRRNSVY